MNDYAQSEEESQTYREVYCITGLRLSNGVKNGGRKSHS